MNKKGLSDIVAVVLTIVATISAFSIMALLLKPVIFGKSLSPEFSCFEMKVSPPIEINFACLDINKSEIRVSIMKKGYIENMPLTFSFNSDTQTGSWICGGDCRLCKIDFNSGDLNYILPAEKISERGTLSISFEGCVFSMKEVKIC